MNPSDLVLLGAFDTLIAIIQNNRELFCKSFDPEAAIQTLKKVRTEFVTQLIAFTQAQVHASETFRVTVEAILADLPVGSDLGAVVRALQHTVKTFLLQGPTPPWPSSSSSRATLGMHLPEDLSRLLAGLQHAIEQKS